MVFDRSTPHGLVEERVRTRRQACVICDLPLVKHNLLQARACTKALEKREPPYCRLSGPSNPKAFLNVLGRRVPRE